jgi:hypothetical protein
MLATKALITRQDLIDMDSEGLILLRPGTDISSSANNINRILTREEIDEYAYIFGQGMPIDNALDPVEIVVIQGPYLGPESYGPVLGISFVTVTRETYIPAPSINGISNNSITIITKSIQEPAHKNRSVHYGIDTTYENEVIVSPGPYLFRNTVYLTVANDSTNTINFEILVGKTPGSETVYSRSSTGTSNLSVDLKLGSYFKLKATPTAWSKNGYIHVEIYQDGILVRSENIFKPYNDPATGLVYINEYFRILKGINYEFKAYVVVGNLYNGAYSNVTGQRACNLLNNT